MNWWVMGGSFLMAFSGVIVAWITTKGARKTGEEANEIARGNSVAEQYSDLVAAYQADRRLDAERTERERSEAAAELAEVKAEYKRQMEQLRGDIRDLRIRTEKNERMFAGYRAYIRTLRGQVFDLGGKPAPWPTGLDQ